MGADIGFIGIGNMGFQMAGNVRKKMPSSATLYIFDVSNEACQRFVTSFGGYGPIEVTASSREVASKSSTVISMVPMDHHARAVYLDAETGVIAAPKDPERLILECSTIAIATTQDIGRKVMDAGVGTYVDAPVSGGVQGAVSGTLSFFCGHVGAVDWGVDVDPVARRVRDTVAWMGAAERINFCGHLGSGLACKVVNNYLLLGNLAVAAEGMAFGFRYGVDKETLNKSIRGSSGDSWVLSFASPVPGLVPGSASSNGFKAGFTSRLCVKDMNLAIEAAELVGIDATLGKVAVKHFEKADQDPRTAGLDGSSIWLHINDEVASHVRPGRASDKDGE